MSHVPTYTVVFAKAPVAGFAKTRLIPALGAQGAALLAQHLLAHAVAAAVQAQLGPVELCVTPKMDHAVFAQLRAEHGVALTLQGEGDLGARMDRALTRALVNHRQVVLIGTDAPALGSDMLRSASEALKTADAVFVPALDGGYVLVGLRAPAPELFKNMVWSTATVMQETRERALVCGMCVVELAAVADIDEPSDLCHVPPQWAQFLT